MNTYEFERGADLKLPPSRIFKFLKDVKLMLYLTPYFEVKRVEKLSDSPLAQGVNYKLEVTDDVTGQDYDDKMTIEDYEEERRIAWAFEDENRRVIFEIQPRGRGTRLVLKEIYQLSEDIKSGHIDRLSRDHLLWVKSIAQYMRLYEKNSLYTRIVRRVMEKIWLPMTPSQRRIALLILLFQLVTLAVVVMGGIMLYLKTIIEGFL